MWRAVVKPRRTTPRIFVRLAVWPRRAQTANREIGLSNYNFRNHEYITKPRPPHTPPLAHNRR